MIEDKIVKVAKGFIGQTEIKGNKGFHDEDFESKMRSIGFQTGHAWCSYFAELVWREAYADDKETTRIIKKLFSGSSYRTLLNFEGAGYKARKVAKPGSVVIWRKKKNGKYTTLGHVGICIEGGTDHFKTVEGNTNGAGSRDGEMVAPKKRKYDFSKDSGLELVGFIYPIKEIPALPFTNKDQGDAFREWVNDKHPATAKAIDLDRSGSYDNSYIKTAWEFHFNEYLELNKI